MSTLKPEPLTAAQAIRFKHALALLQSGSVEQSLAAARSLANEAPHAADAWQLLGMSLQGVGRYPDAEAAFERALGLAPRAAVVSRNFGVMLARCGRSLCEQEQWEAAEPVLVKALALQPDMASAWVDLGSVLRLQGRLSEAEPALKKGEQLLLQRGEEAIGVTSAINGALAESGFPDEAIAAARKLVEARPAHPLAYETLSNLLWEYGDPFTPSEDPLRDFIIAARSQPANLPLQVSLARMLSATGRATEALAILQPLCGADPGNPLLAWFAADALDTVGEGTQAAELYAQAARSELGARPEFLNAWARHAFRSGRIELAARCGSQVVASDPRNQEGWSHLGTAWRLQADEREHWLCGYDTLISIVEVEPPAGYTDMASFLEELEATLEAIHKAMREPVSQSVRGGTQTAGVLFGRDDPVIRAAEMTLRAAVERWLASLPNDVTHPFLTRKLGDIRFSGSWSVRLRAAGRHSNHIHPKGWVSSAFYVALPDCLQHPDSHSSHEGWIQFGQPLEELGLNLPPRRLIQPKPGYLALFPSYIWHGTMPFDAPKSRTTIAFDVQPRQ